MWSIRAPRERANAARWRWRGACASTARRCGGVAVRGLRLKTTPDPSGDDMRRVAVRENRFGHTKHAAFGRTPYCHTCQRVTTACLEWTRCASDVFVGIQYRPRCVAILSPNNIRHRQDARLSSYAGRRIPHAAVPDSARTLSSYAALGSTAIWDSRYVKIRNVFFYCQFRKAHVHVITDLLLWINNVLSQPFACACHAN